MDSAFGRARTRGINRRGALPVSGMVKLLDKTRRLRWALDVQEAFTAATEKSAELSDVVGTELRRLLQLSRQDEEGRRLAEMAVSRITSALASFIGAYFLTLETVFRGLRDNAEEAVKRADAGADRPAEDEEQTRH